MFYGAVGPKVLRLTDAAVRRLSLDIVLLGGVSVYLCFWFDLS